LYGGLNEQLEKERVLLPPSSPRNAASHELSVLRHKVEEDITNGNVDTNRIKLYHKPNGERKTPLDNSSRAIECKISASTNE
jgi:hypothetical protein